MITNTVTVILYTLRCTSGQPPCDDSNKTARSGRFCGECVVSVRSPDVCQQDLDPKPVSLKVQYDLAHFSVESIAG